MLIDSDEIDVDNFGNEDNVVGLCKTVLYVEFDFIDGIIEKIKLLIIEELSLYIVVKRLVSNEVNILFEGFILRSVIVDISGRLDVFLLPSIDGSVIIALELVSSLNELLLV